MKAVVVYESHWGNTAAVARAIASGLGPDTPVLATDEATASVLADADLIVAGAPVIAFRLATDSMRERIAEDAQNAPSKPDLTHPSMRDWLERIPAGKGLAAAFETRIHWSPGGATGAIERGLADGRLSTRRQGPQVLRDRAATGLSVMASSKLPAPGAPSWLKRCRPELPRPPSREPSIGERSQSGSGPFAAVDQATVRPIADGEEMTTRVGINGFGRVGRQSLKALIERAPDIEVVAINDLVPVSLDALLFKHDSTYGAYPGVVDHTDDLLIVDGRQIRVFQEKDPANLPWGDLGVDIVVESTGMLHQRREGHGPHRGRRPEGHHQRPGQGRGHHHRPRRQRRPLRPGDPPHHQQRLAARRTASPLLPRSSTTCSASRRG